MYDEFQEILNFNIALVWKIKRFYRSILPKGRILICLAFFFFSKKRTDGSREKKKEKRKVGRLCHAHQLYACANSSGECKGIQVKLRPSGIAMKYTGEHSLEWLLKFRELGAVVPILPQDSRPVSPTCDERVLSEVTWKDEPKEDWKSKHKEVPGRI